MKKLFIETKEILSNRLYLIVTMLVGILCYGFEFTHFSMGIDDISMEIYLEKGLLPETGRWTLFLINKIIPISAFSPFFSEVIGFAFLYISSAVFCVLLKRLSNDKMPIYVYIVFTSFFLSNPLYSEIDIYYLHNAADLAWLLTAIALVYSYDMIMDCKKTAKSKAVVYSWIVLLIWTAAGCYESFIFVYLTCLLLILLLDGLLSDTKVSLFKILKVSVFGGIVSVISLVMRKIICSVIPFIFRLNDETSTYVSNRNPFSSIKQVLLSDNMNTLKNIIRTMTVRYHLNGLVYLPITLYVVSLFILLFLCMMMTFRKKNPECLLLWFGLESLPLLQAVITGYVYTYRSAQFIPITIAMIFAYMAYIIFAVINSKCILKFAAGFLFSLVLINSCRRLNYNFFLDYMRYENDKQIMRDIAEDIYEVAGAKYGSEITVFLAGDTSVPKSFRNGFYISVSDYRFNILCAIIDPIDHSLNSVYSSVSRDKYYYDGEMQYPLFLWGREAFNGTNDELIKFMNLHGSNLSTIHDPDEIWLAKNDAASMPKWPAEGSIVKKDGYILVNV